jgi:hypothetical protein
MADYKNIKGFNIQYLDSDPPNPIEGQMWFNSTTQTLKGAEVGGITAGTWSSAGSLNTARSGGAGSGTTTAAITAGGISGTRLGNVELYNGSTWTETTDINQNRQVAGSSTYAPNSATLIFGGDAFPVAPQSANTESWNGTSWTELNDLNTGRYGPGGLGASSSSALAFGGVGPGITAVTESWNGTSWTEVNDLNTGRYGGGAIGGTSTAGIYAGGFNTVQVNNVESWNGTSWTEIAEINSAKVDLRAAGIQTSGIVFGGETAGSPVVANTEFWDGSSWTELNDLATARRNLSSGVGSSSSALAIGGGTPPVTAATEEWTAPDILVKTFTTS